MKFALRFVLLASSVLIDLHGLVTKVVLIALKSMNSVLTIRLDSFGFQVLTTLQRLASKVIIVESTNLLGCHSFPDSLSELFDLDSYQMT